MLPARLLTLVVAVVVVAITGCGGASKSSSDASLSTQQKTSNSQTTDAQPSASSTATTSSSHTKPLTRNELITKADLICRRVNAKRAATRFAHSGDYARLVPSLAEYQMAAVAAMRALIPPASMESSWNQIVFYAQEFAHSIAEFGRYAKANKLNDIASVSIAGVKAHEQMLAIAKHEGFHDCATRSG